MEIERIFSSIDQIIEKVNSSRKEPGFSEEIKKRKERTPNMIQDDDDVLRRLARLIAFSQNTRSDLIDKMLSKGIFEIIFHSFQVDRVAQLDPDKIKNLHWEEIKAIRFPRKIESVVYCAKALQLIKSKYGSFLNLLKTSKIPTSLKEESDIENFWQGFSYLKKELINVNMPFFSNTTSLLHFLLHIGYDCIKPDIIVMKVSNEIGIVESKKGERNLLKVVKIIQKYCVNRKLKPSIVDLYLLIYGGQRWARQFVKPSFYRKLSA